MNPSLLLLLAVLFVYHVDARLLRPARSSDDHAVLHVMNRHHPKAKFYRYHPEGHDETAANGVDHGDVRLTERIVADDAKKTLGTAATRYGIAAGTVSYAVVIAGFTYLGKVVNELIGFQDRMVRDLDTIAGGLTSVNNKIAK